MRNAIEIELVLAVMVHFSWIKPMNQRQRLISCAILGYCQLSNMMNHVYILCTNCVQTQSSLMTNDRDCDKKMKRRGMEGIRTWMRGHRVSSLLNCVPRFIKSSFNEPFIKIHVFWLCFWLFTHIHTRTKWFSCASFENNSWKVLFFRVHFFLTFFFSYSCSMHQSWVVMVMVVHNAMPTFKCYFSVEKAIKYSIRALCVRMPTDLFTTHNNFFLSHSLSPSLSHSCQSVRVRKR